MRILVTGGAGFIGSHIVEAYLAEGHEVRVIDNLATGRRVNVPREAKLHEVDIHAREVESIFEEFRPEVVNHLAAQASVNGVPWEKPTAKGSFSPWAATKL